MWHRYRHCTGMVHGAGMVQVQTGIDSVQVRYRYSIWCRYATGSRVRYRYSADMVQSWHSYDTCTVPYLYFTIPMPYCAGMVMVQVW